jgi:hypothetical protein
LAENAISCKKHCQRFAGLWNEWLPTVGKPTLPKIGCFVNIALRPMVACYLSTRLKAQAT